MISERKRQRDKREKVSAFSLFVFELCVTLHPKNRLTMKIETFTEEDIREAAQLAYPVWGEGHAANGQGEEFGLLMAH